jgi:hypothetical protein
MRFYQHLRRFCEYLSPIRPRRPDQFRRRLELEHLEERQLLSITDMTQLAQQWSPHAAPTVLNLNFDGGVVSDYANIGGVYPQEHMHAFETEALDNQGQRDQDIQDILFKTAQLFAPFNVQVERMRGMDTYDSSDHGNTTIFIGGDVGNPANTSNNQHRNYSFTPSTSVDYPGADFTKGSTHQPNSDGFDLAFVDPTSGTTADTNTWRTSQSTLSISESIGHEAGHTFGLAHIRTVGTDTQGAPVQGPNPPEMMSYDSYINQYFMNSTFTITSANYNGSTTQLGGTVPWWQPAGAFFPNPITTQNSYTYLQGVLGPRNLSNDPYHHIADRSAVDNTYLNLEFAAGRSPWIVGLGSPVNASILRQGDYDVFTFTAPSTQTVTFAAHSVPNSTLDPVVLLYDASGQNLQAYSPGGQVNFQVQAGQTYKVVVGARDAASAGAFQLSVKGPVTQTGNLTNLDGWALLQIATAQNKDHRMEVFALGGDHVVYYRSQSLTNYNVWSGWTPIPGWYAIAGSGQMPGYAQWITVANEQDGRIDLFILGTNHAVYYTSQIKANTDGWAGWTNLGGNILSFVVGEHSNGTTNTNLEVFAINTQHQYSHKWQTQANTANWSDWNNTGYGNFTSLAVGNNQNGSLQLFGIQNGTLWTTWQPSNGDWNSWKSLGGWALQQLTVANNQDGRLEVFVIGGDHAVYHQWQTALNAGDNLSLWSGWSYLGGDNVQQIAVGQTATGALQVDAVCYLNGSGYVEQIAQWGPNSGWAANWSFGPGPFQQLALIQDPYHQLHLFGLGWDTALYES